MKGVIHLVSRFARLYGRISNPIKEQCYVHCTCISLVELVVTKRS